MQLPQYCPRRLLAALGLTAAMLLIVAGCGDRKTSGYQIATDGSRYGAAISSPLSSLSPTPLPPTPAAALKPQKQNTDWQIYCENASDEGIVKPGDYLHIEDTINGQQRAVVSVGVDKIVSSRSEKTATLSFTPARNLVSRIDSGKKRIDITVDVEDGKRYYVLFYSISPESVTFRLGIKCTISTGSENYKFNLRNDKRSALLQSKVLSQSL